ncbi:hypothetical protein K458DRAFT_429462 [Lentithecium fluviatile CBS 122367]|uniref:ribonuclease H n=1 Tax=Lentithecium fluviatile CBS 122367 TaxID=1168545 RepID=A0A6G1J7B2_9PLEO|nr:hypothetical protein K458DRAFT_429462 [Lentithecium fluviatile CBS 122367]
MSDMGADFIPLDTTPVDAGATVTTAIDLTGDGETKVRFGVSCALLQPGDSPPLFGLPNRTVGGEEILGIEMQQRHRSSTPPSTSRRSARLRGSARASNLLSRHSYNNQKQFKAKWGAKNAPELLIIDGAHANFSFWKDKVYQELAIAAEHKISRLAVRMFNKQTITTVVPNRYLRPPTLDGQLEFPGAIERLEPVPAVRQAYQEHTSARRDTARMVLWTDGSARKLHRGFAVAWRLSTATGWDRWEAAGYKAIGELLDSSGMEALAVIKALDKAHELILRFPGRFTAIAIYTDATFVLETAKRPAKSSLGRHLVKKANLLRQCAAEISLRWCPGHSKVPGNELADRIAGLAGSHVYKNMTEVVDLSDDDV